MKTIFVDEIVDHSISMKCVPPCFTGQSIEQLEVHITPETVLSETDDSLGNHMLYGKINAPHDLFVMKINGIAQVTGEPVMQSPKEKRLHQQSLYQYPTRATMPGKTINSFMEKELSGFSVCNHTTMELAVFYMERVYEQMQYQPAVTGISTTAEEAFAIKKGVCQDYAHILLTLLRMKRIPARYVVGMMIGEGASHAWVEVFDGASWWGIDPTNHKQVDDTYIKISHGRDYQDCLVERGIFKGDARQQKVVGVKVKEMR